MKIGLSLDPRLGKDIQSLLNFAEQWSFETVLLKMDHPDILAFLTKAVDPKFRRMLIDANLEYIVHMPEVNVDLASLNTFVRKMSRDVVLRAIQFTEEIGCRQLVISCPGLSYYYSPKQKERAVGNFVSSLRKVKEYADLKGITLLLKNEGKSENTNLIGDPNELKFIAEELGVYVAFDAGNAHSLGLSETFVTTLGDLIKVVLLHDNKGGKNEYMPLGAGDLLLERILYQLIDIKYTGPLIIENFEENEARVSKEVLDTAIKDLTEKTKRKK